MLKFLVHSNVLRMQTRWRNTAQISQIFVLALSLKDVSDIVATSGVQVFASVVKGGGQVKALECQRLRHLEP